MLDRLGNRPGLASWCLTVGITSVALVGGAWGPWAHVTVGTPGVFFWIMVLGAAGCWVGAIAAMVVGLRDGLAEVAVLGSALAVESSLGLVHGLAAPGVLLPQSGVLGASALLAAPLALLVAAPLITPSWRASRWVCRRPRAYSVSCVLGGAVVAVALLAARDGVPAPSAGSLPTLALSLSAVGAWWALSWRQLRLYWIGGRPACLVASLSLAAMATSGLIWIAGGAFTPAWWLAHGLDLAGVLAGTVALLYGYRQPGRRLADVLAPVLSRDPLVALELGFSPPVHRFVADLEAKDRITRDHVIRVGELAVRAGLHLGLSPRRIRRLGIAAVLHDIGKLGVPDELLTKPGRLTDDEMAVMRGHTEHGHALLASSAALADVAGLVRGHHERPDGTGYPDGLLAEQIPLEAAIISVCDAYDAMAHTRHYRQGLGPERAVMILREHAGTQWLPAAVEAVIAVLPAVAADNPAFDAVGRPAIPRPREAPDDICQDVVPAEMATAPRQSQLLQES